MSWNTSRNEYAIRNLPNGDAQLEVELDAVAATHACGVARPWTGRMH